MSSSRSCTGLIPGLRKQSSPGRKSRTTIGQVSNLRVTSANQDVIDLYGRLTGGEKVIVLTASGEMPTGLYIPPVIAPKKAEPEVPASAIPTLAVLPPPAIVTSTPTVAPAAASATTTAPATTTTAPAVAPAPAVTDEGKCKVALVNGVCPPDQVMN